MKATGIVRRIDDLGRIVIPKEIRRTLRIREADPLEIFTDREGEIILKKYSPIGEMTTFARQYAESLAQVSGHTVLIADRDQFIAAAGGCRNLIGKPLSREMEQQRVAIARALVSKPAIVLADEPTGNLDSKTSADVLGLLKTTSQKFHQTLVMITHNSEIAQLADRIIRIEDGKIVQ